MPDDTSRISLILVDDHPVVRNGLRGMFESEPGFTVLGEASNGVEAVELAVELDPDVILMDLRMPGGSGLDAITELTRRGIRSKVLVLTTWDTDTDTLPAIEAGATGYLLKDAPQADLFNAVRQAAEGRTVLSPRGRVPARHRCPYAGTESARRARAAGSGAGREGYAEPRHRPRAVHQRSHGEDPSQPRLHQTGCHRPGRGRCQGLRTGHPRPLGKRTRSQE
jgi:CheY-like chemotaxis protein